MLCCAGTTTAYADGPPAGMVAAYGFDEGGGVIAADTSGEGNDGLVEGAAWVAGTYGGGLDFDGVDDSVSVFDADSLDVPGALTISAWVRPDEIEGRSQLVVVKERGTTSATYLLEADSPGDMFPEFALRPAGWSGVSGTTELAEAQWSHVSGSWDGATMKLYVNGQLVGSTPMLGPILTSDRPLRIGGTGVFGGLEYFDGRIAEVRVYDRALSAAEIEDDMEVAVLEQTEPQGTITSPDDLVAAYGFDEGSGAVAGDASGEGNDGSISGAAWSSPGRFGNALTFDGSDDRVVVPDDPSLDLSGGLTLEAWIKPDIHDGDWRTVMMKEGALDLAYGLYSSASTFNSSKPLVAIDDNASRVLSGPTVLPLNEWSHIAGTYNGTTLRFYRDGELVATKPASRSLPNTSNPLSIGGNDVWDEYFDG
jgi:hypothetical protein